MIAKHDIACGSNEVPYDDEVDSPYIRYLLSLGLEKLFEISGAKLYEECYRLIVPSPSGYPYALEYFLYDVLNLEDTYLRDIPLDEETKRIKAPFYRDPDNGPARVWRWAHQNVPSFIDMPSRQGFREWAFVMWDLSRLESMGIFEPCGALVDESLWSVSQPGPEDLDKLHEDMVASWKWRSKLFSMGATGPWGLDDNSKVTWMDGKKPVETSLLLSGPESSASGVSLPVYANIS